MAAVTMPAVRPVSTAWGTRAAGCGEERARDPARMFDCRCGTGDSYCARCEEYLPCPECAPCEAEEREDGGEASDAD